MYELQSHALFALLPRLTPDRLAELVAVDDVARADIKAKAEAGEARSANRHRAVAGPVVRRREAKGSARAAL